MGGTDEIFKDNNDSINLVGALFIAKVFIARSVLCLPQYNDVTSILLKKKPGFKIADGACPSLGSQPVLTVGEQDGGGNAGKEK